MVDCTEHVDLILVVCCSASGMCKPRGIQLQLGCRQAGGRGDGGVADVLR